MDVTRILEADHRDAEALIARIHDAEGERRRPLIEKLIDALRNHMELEETTIYPLIKELAGDEMVQAANTEHELARKAMADVVRLAPDKPGFGAAMEVLEAGLKHHIKDEEAEAFPEFRTNALALESVATPFMEKRLALGMEMSGLPM